MYVCVYIYIYIYNAPPPTPTHRRTHASAQPGVRVSWQGERGGMTMKCCDTILYYTILYNNMLYYTMQNIVLCNMRYYTI